MGEDFLKIEHEEVVRKLGLLVPALARYIEKGNKEIVDSIIDGVPQARVKMLIDRVHEIHHITAFRGMPLLSCIVGPENSNFWHAALLWVNVKNSQVVQPLREQTSPMCFEAIFLPPISYKNAILVAARHAQDWRLYWGDEAVILSTVPADYQFHGTIAPSLDIMRELLTKSYPGRSEEDSMVFLGYLEGAIKEGVTFPFCQKLSNGQTLLFEGAWQKVENDRVAVCIDGHRYCFCIRKGKLWMVIDTVFCDPFII